MSTRALAADLEQLSAARGTADFDQLSDEDKQAVAFYEIGRYMSQLVEQAAASGAGEAEPTPSERLSKAYGG